MTRWRPRVPYPDVSQQDANKPGNPRLIHEAFRELYERAIEDSDTITTLVASSSGAGSGSGAATLLNRWTANGPYRAPDTAVDGGWVAPSTFTVAGVFLHRATAGTAGSTTLDLNMNGTTMYTTQANRPTIAYNDADSIVMAPLPDTTAVPLGAVLTVDADVKETGKPRGWSLLVFGA